MRYKTGLRLALKVLGLYVLIGAVPEIIQQAGGLVSAWYNPQFGSFRFFSLGWFLSLALKLAMGLYLLFGGRWLVDKMVPGNRPYCPECAYDLTGAVSERCPECGTPFSWDAVRPGGPIE